MHVLNSDGEIKVIGAQGAQGFQGAQGLQGLQGAVGAQGLQGLQGAAGAAGAQGNQGFQGLQGAQGFQGFQGLQGSQGHQGAQGNQGYQGIGTIFAKKVYTFHANSATTTLQAFGHPIQTGEGVTIANINDSDGSWVGYQTTADESTQGWYNTTFSIQTQFKPIFEARIKTYSTVTNHNKFIGIVSDLDVASGKDLINGFHGAIFWGASANWQCITNDGSGDGTATDSGVAINANTVYNFKIDCTDPASILFYINDSLVATRTTDLPSTTAVLSWYTRGRTTIAQTVKMILSKVRVELY